MNDHNQVATPAPSPPLPAPRQLAWQELELTMFLHFGVNTFTDREWGEGTEDPRAFNPTELDAGQWVSVAQAAGFKMLILTAKHHDGFCLWPSRYTDHSVKSSPWRGGRGDVVRELADACQQAGMKLGLYLSPWDRHERTYGDSPWYNEHYRNQLRELLTQYGPVHEVWFDGACGEGPNGKRQVYDWESYWGLVRELQPEAVMFSDVGPDVRWVGNESGRAADPCWSPVDPRRIPHPGGGGEDVIAALQHGNRDGTIWRPPESDVSIRPGWFWHATEDEKVKSLDHLLDIYFASVGRNSQLLLNVPPNRDGLLSQPDVRRLQEFRAALDRIFRNDLARGKPVKSSHVRGNDSRYGGNRAVDGRPETYWATDDDVRGRVWLELDLGMETRFNTIELREPIEFGQRVAAYTVDILDTGNWRRIAAGHTIGRRKLDRFPTGTARFVRLYLCEYRAAPLLRSVAIYRS